MNPEILFSIIVPSYNRAGFIATTIHSILEQTYFKFEVIIVDDGSTDATTEVVAPLLLDSRVRYFKIANSERGAARNYGTKQSKGDYITFLDSDDLFLPWHLRNAFEKVTLLKMPPVFHLGYEILHTDGKVSRLPSLPNPVNDKLVEGNFLSCMGVFLRRDVALENQFDEDRNLSGSEDYELWMRVAARYPILTFREVTSRLINHDSRSVITTDPKRLVTRIQLLDFKLQADDKFMSRFGERINVFSAYRTLYLALHLCLSGEKWLAAKSLIYTVREYPWVIFNYRFGVAVKKIIFW